jgi:hypothetical protein
MSPDTPDIKKRAKYMYDTGDVFDTAAGRMFFPIAAAFLINLMYLRKRPFLKTMSRQTARFWKNYPKMKLELRMLNFRYRTAPLFYTNLSGNL